MMTKKRTSSLANMKLLLVVPVIGLVFLAISAYKEIPDPSTQKIIPITVPQTLLTSSDPASSTSKPISKPASKPISKSPSAAASEPRSETVLPPPPPPPPSESTNMVTEESGPDPFVVVEQMPMFPGGDAELLKYIGANTKYPESAKTKNIEGKVIVRFCVTAEGGVSRISILKGIDPELDAEALRVVKTLPAFRPGSQGGVSVPVWYMVPISFALK